MGNLKKIDELTQLSWKIAPFQFWRFIATSLIRYYGTYEILSASLPALFQFVSNSDA